MLEPNEIIHAGITVRGVHAQDAASAKKAAKVHLDGWQASREAGLPPGSSFELLQEKVTPNGPEALVTRYVQVVSAS